MRRTITLLLLILSTTLTYAAETIVRGRVKDAQTSEGEPGAVLQFYKADNPEKPVAFCVTDADGKFSQELSVEGEYKVVFTSLGRKTVTKTFSVKGDEYVLEDILAADDAETLAESSVTALHNLVKMEVDKMTYKVEDDVDSKSYTLLDMLRKVPMVTVDAQDNITVNGSSNFQILVDGKPNVMISSNPSMVFKSMPASFAKSVEVITNPGVKYDAEGVGGVLNIVTNRAAMGAAGGASAMDGYNATVGVMAATIGSSTRAFLSGQKGKFSYSANLAYTQIDIKGIRAETTREQLDQAGNVLTTLKSTLDSDTHRPATIGGLNLGYEIDSLRLVSAAVSLSGITSKATTDNLFQYSLLGNPSFEYGSKANTNTGIHSYTASVDYQRSFAGQPGRSLVVSYQYSGAPTTTDGKSLFSGSSIPGFDMTDRSNNGRSNTVENTIQVDYTTPIKDRYTLNAGGKYINRRSYSKQDLLLKTGDDWVKNDAGSVDYLNTNNIAALYGEMGYKKDNFGAKAGLRYEHTFVGAQNNGVNANDFNLDYGNLVPAASIQYNIGMLQNIGLSYNMRISRPGITYLNPYVDVSDPTARSYGNPDIETERAHNVSLTYNLMSPILILSASLRQSYCGNAINSYSFYDASGLLNTTYTNNTINSTSGVNAMIMLNLSAKTRILFNGEADYVYLKSEALGLENSGITSTAFISLQQTLPWDIRLSAASMMTGRTYTLDGWADGMKMITGGLTKSFLDDKLTVGVGGLIPLTKSGYMESESYSASKDYRMASYSRFPLKQAIFNISWTFGSNKSASVKKSRKSITNDDIINISQDSNTAETLMNMQ